MRLFVINVKVSQKPAGISNEKAIWEEFAGIDMPVRGPKSAGSKKLVPTGHPTSMRLLASAWSARPRTGVTAGSYFGSQRRKKLSQLPWKIASMSAAE